MTKSDCSWVEAGAQRQRVRDEKIQQAALRLGGFWSRRTLSFYEQVVYKKAERLGASAGFLDTLRTRDYSLAFRKACVDIELHLVQLLLDYKKHGKIDFDINAVSKKQDRKR